MTTIGTEQPRESFEAYPDVDPLGDQGGDEARVDGFAWNLFESLRQGGQGIQLRQQTSRFGSLGTLTASLRSSSGGPTASTPVISENLFGLPDDTTIPEHLRVLRRMGMVEGQDERTIELALQYLEWLDPRLKEIVVLVRARMEAGDLTIEFAPAGQKFSSAKPTFNGIVDRSSPDYGKVISLEQGSWPDTLLHEILHILPVEVISRYFDIPVEFPPIDPSLSFAELKANIFENIRMNEVISFGANCTVFDLEVARGACHHYPSEMKRDLHAAWRVNGYQGIRATWNAYLSHYEDRLSQITTVLALIVKIEGRTNLTDEEYEMIRKISWKKWDDDDFKTYAQRYFNRHLEKLVARGVKLPPDFYSLSAVWKRMTGGSYRRMEISETIDFLFQSLERLEVDADLERVELTMSPVSSPRDPQERVRLFQSYSNLVTRRLEEAPEALTRNEVAAIVNYARLVPHEVAAEIAKRLDPYLGPGFADLRVTLAIVLYQKGYHDWAKEQIMTLAKLEDLEKLAPLILNVMGEDFLLELIERHNDVFNRERSSHAESFSVLVQSRVNFDHLGDAKAALLNVLNYPEIHHGWIWQNIDPKDGLLDPLG